MTERLSGAGLLLVETRLHRFREEFGVRRAPVDCFRLLRELQDSGRISIEWQESSSFSDAFDAATVWFPSVRSYLIVSRRRPFNWKRTSPGRRCNFTMAHELGHIFCGHLHLPASLKGPETVRLEDLEADAFAARLLMPEEELGYFRSVQEAADGLLVSESAVRRRLQETGISCERRSCPACGFEGIPPAARFCRQCGYKMAAGPNPAHEPEVAWYPPLPRECPVCGQKAYGAESECVNCGIPRRNRCVPEYNQPSHTAPPDALYCEICGAETFFRQWRK